MRERMRMAAMFDEQVRPLRVLLADALLYLSDQQQRRLAVARAHGAPIMDLLSTVMAQALAARVVAAPEALLLRNRYAAEIGEDELGAQVFADRHPDVFPSREAVWQRSSRLNRRSLRDSSLLVARLIDLLEGGSGGAPMTSAIWQWANVYVHASRAPAGEHVEYPRAALLHPREAGAVVSAAWPVGQCADYRFPGDSPFVGLHIQEYPTSWVVAIEQTHPDRDAHAVAHREMVATWCLSSAVVGAAFGVAMTKKRDGALLEDGVGLLAAALFLASDQ